jgi:translation initiation factor IF-3
MSKAHVTKELKLSPKISENDFMVRVNRGREFLGKGHKIKITVMFRGREIIHPELGHGVIEKFLEKIADIGVLESRSQSGRMMLAFVNPK